MTEKDDGNNDRVELTEQEYQDLLDSAPDHRSRLAVRLQAEGSLRATELSSLNRRKLLTILDERMGHRVDGRNDPGEIQDVGADPDSTPTCANLREEVIDYCERHGIDPDEQVFEIPVATISRLLNKTTENAPVRTGNDDYRDITTVALRFFCARTLSQKNLSPKEVKRALGWENKPGSSAYK